MNATEHERAVELLPWLVNGSLRGADLAWLNSHLADCEHCREEQQYQQRVRDAVARQPAVELAPQASFKRLWSRIEAEADAPLDSVPARAADLATSPRRSGFAWGRVAGVAAGVAALAVASMVLWRGLAPTANQDGYRTVSSAASPMLPGQIRVVFADTATVADIRNILAGARLEAAAGPTAAGVFTLQPAAGLPGADLQAITRSLRGDPRVRFAELR